MKTIKNLALSLKISKEAIYKKIKIQLKHELKEHIIKKHNVTYIDEEGEKIIAQSLKPDKLLDKNQSKLQDKIENHTKKNDIQPSIQLYKLFKRTISHQR